MNSRPRRVFISHTAEFAAHPRPRSFVAAAVAAAVRAGDVPIDMSYFTARESAPADYCRRKVLDCDIYIALVGFRYGSLVPDADTSYVEFEFSTAVAAGMPRFIFMLSPDAEVPLGRFFDSQHHERQRKFRERLSGAGTTTAEFRTVEGLESLVYQALRESRETVGVGSADWIDPPAPAGAELGVAALFQLPPDIVDFTNQRDVLQVVLDIVGDQAPDTPRALVITTLTGKPGIGKTALAIRLGHQLKSFYPAGQLYVNLRGYENEALNPYDVLGDFLRALGIPGKAVPSRPEERVNLYRSRLANQRFLIILDNARDEAQVRDLLPGSGTSTVIITSRSRLAGLDGMRLVNVEVLEPADAVRLLGLIVGEARVAGEPAAAAEIAALCGYLPLAIRIAGARLVARPHWSLGVMAQRLRDERGRLYELRVADREVRANFALSYRGLPEISKRLFRRLGIIPGKDFPPWVEHPLLDSYQDTFDHLDALADVNLLEPTGTDAAGQPRYRFHDLIRLFARQQLSVDEAESERTEALRRFCACYLTLAEQADLHLLGDGRREVAAGAVRRVPRLPDSVLGLVRRRPEAWLMAEHIGIMNLVELAFEHELWEETWELAGTLGTFFDREAMWSYWRRTYELGLRAAQNGRSRSGTAGMLRGLGVVAWYESRWNEAVPILQEAVSAHDAAGDTVGRALALRNLGVVFRDQSRWPEAADCYEEALAAFRAVDDTRRAALTLRNAGDVYRDLNRFAEARSRLEECRSMYEALGDERGLAYTLRSLGDTLWGEGELGRAAACFEQCIPIFRRRNDRRALGRALRNRGLVFRDQGRPAEARAAYTESLEIFRELGDRHGEARTLQSLGVVHADDGEFAEAAECHGRSLAVFEELGDRLWQGKTFYALGSAHSGMGDDAHGEQLRRRGLDILTELGALDSPEARRWLG
jgi:tetratricopeptide (TPR) repeat protein